MKSLTGIVALSAVFLAACNQSPPSTQNQPAAATHPQTQSVPTSTNQPSMWTFSSKTDALTDKRISTAMSGRAEGVINHAAVVRCTGGTLQTFFDFGAYLGNDEISVRYRLDKSPLVKTKWSPSADGTAVFSLEPTATARLLTTGKTFIIEAEDFRGQDYRASYDLSGAKQAIGTVLKACDKAAEPLDATVNGLRHDVAVELENWSPSSIVYNKRLMISIGAYRGAEDSSMTPDFATAVQTFYDNYISECKSNKVHDVNCTSLHIFWKNNMKPVMPPIDTVIYDKAKQLGKLPKDN